MVPVALGRNRTCYLGFRHNPVLSNELRGLEQAPWDCEQIANEVYINSMKANTVNTYRIQYKEDVEDKPETDTVQAYEIEGFDRKQDSYTFLDHADMVVFVVPKDIVVSIKAINTEDSEEQAS